MYMSNDCETNIQRFTIIYTKGMICLQRVNLYKVTIIREMNKFVDSSHNALSRSISTFLPYMLCVDFSHVKAFETCCVRETLMPPQRPFFRKL